MALYAMYHSVAVIKCRRSGQTWQVRIRFCFLFFYIYFTDETEEYFGLLIHQHVSVVVVANSHANSWLTAALWGNWKDGVRRVQRLLRHTLGKCASIHQFAPLLLFRITQKSHQVSVKTFFR